MTIRGVLLAVLAVASVASDVALANGEFPLRERYREVQVISTEELFRIADQALIVDVRSRYEYETMHINGAIHIPVGSADFLARLRAARDARAGATTVFYCNGHTCAKSYDAYLKAAVGELDNLRTYDGGIETWSNTYPEATALLGRTPIRAQDLIASEDFKSRVISAEKFDAMAERADVVVVDIRDVAQRDNNLYPFREARVPLDARERLNELVRRVQKEKRILLVYDKTGHQVKWFQYHLRDLGLSQYFFLRGGSEGYYTEKFGLQHLRAQTDAAQQNGIAASIGAAEQAMQRASSVGATVIRKTAAGAH